MNVSPIGTVKEDSSSSETVLTLFSYPLLGERANLIVALRRGGSERREVKSEEPSGKDSKKRTELRSSTASPIETDRAPSPCEISFVYCPVQYSRVSPNESLQ